MFLFKRELLKNKKSFFVTVICLVLFCYAVLAKAEVFVSDPQALVIIDQLPEVIKIVYGLSDFDLSTYSGFYQLTYQYLVIILSLILSSNLLSIFNNEYQNKTDLYLLSKPLKRIKIASYKIAAVLVKFSFINIIVLLILLVIGKSFNEANLVTTIFYIHLWAYFVSLIFGALTLFIAACLKSTKRFMLFLSVVVFNLFFISSLNQINDFFGLVNQFNPFAIYDVTTILELKIDILNIMLIIIVFIIACTLYTISYEKAEVKN